VCSSAKAGIIRGGEIRRGIFGQPSQGIPRSTNFSPGRSAGIWEYRNHENALIIVNLSGRGDKDVAQVADKVKLQMSK
jgi:hypothetical protein